MKKHMVLGLLMVMAACGGSASVELDAALVGAWVSVGTPAYAQQEGWTSYRDELRFGDDHRYTQQADLTYAFDDAQRAGCALRLDIDGSWAVSADGRGVTLATTAVRETLTGCVDATQNGVTDRDPPPSEEFLVDVDDTQLTLSRADDDRVNAYLRR